jgi:hypothetical protein
MNANSIRPIDLIIDASSAATGARDSATSTYNISAIIQADLVSHIEISQALTKANGKHPDIVFISSILTTVKTADREIYSSIKRLREILLEKFFQENGNCSILIIRLGKFRNFYAMAKKIEHLIAQSQNSRQFKIKQMGVDSLILYTLNLIHPVLATVCAKISRAMTENRTL